MIRRSSFPRRTALATSVAALLAVTACSDATVPTTDTPPGKSPVDAVGRVVLSATGSALAVGDSLRLSAQIFSASGASIARAPAYRSTNVGVATVSGSGVVVARSAGSASIIASVGSVADTLTVTVSPTSIATPWPMNAMVRVRFDGAAPSATVSSAFTKAASRINQLMHSTAGASAVPVNVPAGMCDDSQADVRETVPGILIVAAVRTIDGAGSVLGLAGPCVVRSGTRGIPALGVMAFDVADMEQMASRGILDGVILHEMLHVLGVGTLWGPGYQGLVADPDGADPLFRGERASAAYGVVGAINAMLGVPVENTGGSGTRGGHWRESVFGDELMTGWVGGTMQLSTVTLSALGDMGYDVDMSKADPYSLSSLLGARTAMAASEGVQLEEAMLRPIVRIDGNGTIQ